MTENQQKVLEVAKNAAPWKRVAERDVIFLARHLIDTGQKPATFIPAIGHDVGPLGDASIDNNLYASVKSIENINNYLKSCINNNIGEIEGIRQRCFEAGENLHNFLKQSKFEDYKNDLLKFKDLYTKLTPFLLLAVFADKMLEKEVADLVVDKTGKLDEDYFRNICYVQEFNTSTKEIIDLLKIAIDKDKNNWSDDNNDLSKRLVEHEKNYGWLGARGQFESDWTVEDFLLRVKQYKNPKEELENILAARDKAEEITTQFIKEYELSKSEIHLIETAKQFVYLRTYRTEMMYGSHSLVRPLLNKIAKHLNIYNRDILYLTVEEIISLLDGEKFDFKINIEQRKKGFYIIQYGNDLDFFVGDEMKEVDKLRLFEEHRNIDIDNDIKGQCAWKGKVGGRVRIVKYEDDIKKVEAGDILVAVMTFPNFIPAMEKAAAFVTDEGGILCHAAIVSREMKKPCVIGTKIATKVLKDGDMVEVDAENGIIKKLNK